MELEKNKKITIEICNKNTLFFDDEINNRIVYLFNYNNDIELSPKVIWDLFWQDRWDILKHPLVFNYIHELMLHSASLIFAYTCFHVFILFHLLYIVDLTPNYWVLQTLNISTIIWIIFFLIHQYLGFYWDYWYFLWISLSDACMVALNRIFSAHLSRTTSDPSLPVPFYELDLNESFSYFLHICVIFEKSFRLLRILRCYPGGIYVMMFFRILESFVKTIFIWVVIGLSFAGSFKILLKDSGFPWEPANNSTNSIAAMLGTFTKISAMMIGELEVNEILIRKSWLANVVLIIFEATTVILLMNLMMSLAVGDVKELRESVEERVIVAKIWYCYDTFVYYSTLCTLIPYLNKWSSIKKLNNVVFIHKRGHYTFNLYEKFLNVRFPAEQCNCHENDGTFYAFVENPISPKIATLTNEKVKENLSNKTDMENRIRKIKRWLFGMSWSFAIDIKKSDFAFIF